jgi:hypothetical protein
MEGGRGHAAGVPRGGGAESRWRVLYRCARCTLLLLLLSSSLSLSLFIAPFLSILFSASIGINCQLTRHVDFELGLEIDSAEVRGVLLDGEGLGREWGRVVFAFM